MSVHLLTAIFLLRIVSALPLNSPLLPSYHYIVVGGGPAGLTVANRLSEDPSVNVLLLEAGPADNGQPDVEIPGLIGEDIGSVYDWNLSTVAQTYLDGASRSIPQGHALGGGTIINGMLWNRGGQGDYQDWMDLGNPGWSWSDLLPYFIKSETYTPVYSQETAEQFSIEEWPNAHGFSGPVNVSFPKYFWNSSAMLFSALNEIGVPTAFDPATGLLAGASFLPLDVDPVTEERSDAKKAYYDPYAYRPNLWVSTGQLVTQVLFEDRPANSMASNPIPGDTSNGQGGAPGVPGGIFGATTTLHVSHFVIPDATTLKQNLIQRWWDALKAKLRRRQTINIDPASSSNLIATGVEYASDAQSPRRTISATREVIVAAGALHSPQLLMLSGIGPSSALQALDIPVNVDLPGVGSNLQDHGQVWCWYPYHNDSYPNPTELASNETFASDAWTQYWANRTGPLTSGAIDGVAFPALPYIVNGSTAIADAAAAQSPGQYLPSEIDSTVLSGYTQQHSMMTSALMDTTRAVYELLNANDGVLTVATMRPFSRGTVTLSTSKPFDPPLIDPRYGSNPIDIQVLQAAMAFNQRLLYTDSLSEMDPVQLYPPADASDAEIVQYINTRWQTEYHPVGTNAMLPIELGGVVSPDLMVYGTENLRIVDSSIMPMLPAAHLQAVVYGIAEKAADIIKAANAGASTSSLQSNMSSSSPLLSLSSTAQSQLSATSSPQSTSSMLPSATNSSTTPTTAPTVAAAKPVTWTSFVTVVFTQTVYGR